MRDALYYYQAEWMPPLQTWLAPFSDVLVRMTKIGDPKFVYMALFPLALGSASTSSRLLAAAAVGEWVNIILKWILMEDRPYWWIPEQSEVGGYGAGIPPLLQFPVTCETGPGSPSGHVMVSAAVWAVLLHAVRHPPSGLQVSSWRLRDLGWILTPAYYVALGLIAVSRVYIGAHFLHQCLLAAFVGKVVGEFLRSRDVARENFLGIAAAFAVAALVVRAATGLVVRDAGWSLRLARKWCADGSWVRLDTTPLASVVRPCAALVGLAWSRDALRSSSSSWRIFVVRGVAGLVFSLAAGSALELVHSSTALFGAGGFYVGLFVVVTAYVRLCYLV